MRACACAQAIPAWSLAVGHGRVGARTPVLLRPLSLPRTSPVSVFVRLWGCAAGQGLRVLSSHGGDVATKAKLLLRRAQAFKGLKQWEKAIEDLSDPVLREDKVRCRVG